VVETLTENLSEAFVAPLLAYATGGLTLAYIYRFVNTADAMVGYHTRDLEWYGKAAARCDDCLNFVPARMTALCLVHAATRSNRRRRMLIEAVAHDAERTSSPNAGWPMSAAAHVLGIRLTKRVGGTTLYDLNSCGRTPTVQDISRAIGLAQRAARIAVEMISPPERQSHRAA
jgi:adenosylcobinamide-phosphate synthase